MGRCEAVAASGLLLGALVCASTGTALNSAGIADASCTTVTGTGADARCTSDPTSFAVKLGKDSSVSAQGTLAGSAPGGNKTAASGAAPGPGPGSADTASAPGNAVAVAEG